MTEAYCRCGCAESSHRDGDCKQCGRCSGFRPSDFQPRRGQHGSRRPRDRRSGWRGGRGGEKRGR